MNVYSHLYDSINIICFIYLNEIQSSNETCTQIYIHSNTHTHTHTHTYTHTHTHTQIYIYIVLYNLKLDLIRFPDSVDATDPQTHLSFNDYFISYSNPLYVYYPKVVNHIIYSYLSTKLDRNFYL